MNKTYEDIIVDLKSKYLELSGETVEKTSPREKRLETVASELFALSCFGDFVFRQMFVKTASGEYLDMHGEERGCTRLRASCSHGMLTFGVRTPAAEDIVIPEGTICSVGDKPYIQFRTNEQGFIPEGGIFCRVSATSLTTGYEANAAAGEISVMVNAPLMVEGVTNESAFIDGCDEETDEAYRKRIMRLYDIPLDGLNRSYIESKIRLATGREARVLYSHTPGVIEVVVKNSTMNIPQKVIRGIEESVELLHLAGATLNITMAAPIDISLSVDAIVEYGADHAGIESEIRRAITETFNSCEIGESKSIPDLTRAIGNIEGVRSIDISCSKASTGVISCRANMYLRLTRLEVGCIEQ